MQRKSEKGTNKMMKNVWTHANAEWREQRSTSALILVPKNQYGVRAEGRVVHKMPWVGQMGVRWKREEQMRERSKF